MFRKTLFFVSLTLMSAVAFAEDSSLEPCLNGQVSASGNFPNQSMEDQLQAYLRWRDGDLYYLFRIAAGQRQTAALD